VLLVRRTIKQSVFDIMVPAGFGLPAKEVIFSFFRICFMLGKGFCTKQVII